MEDWSVLHQYSYTALQLYPVAEWRLILGCFAANRTAQRTVSHRLWGPFVERSSLIKGWREIHDFVRMRTKQCEPHESKSVEERARLPSITNWFLLLPSTMYFEVQCILTYTPRNCMLAGTPGTSSLERLMVALLLTVRVYYQYVLQQSFKIWLSTK